MKRLAGFVQSIRQYARRFAAQWRADTERINEYNRDVCLQRDAQRQEYLIYRGIVK